MSKFKFSGTLKEMKTSSNPTVLYFVPDQECVVTQGDTGDKEKYVVLLPTDSKQEGIVFKYDGRVEITDKGKVMWLPDWELDSHYVLELKVTREAAKCQIEIKGTSVMKYLTLDSVTKKV